MNPGDDEPGVFFDRLTVVFREGTSATRIAEINARISARLLIAPSLGTWYRVKLPATINAADASRYYLDQAEVSGVMPAVDFGTFHSPADNTNAVQTDLIHMAEAWDIALDAGTIGRSTVISAIIEGGGLDIAHADIYRNIWINQGELPLSLFDSNDSGTIDASEIAQYDLDPPGAPDGLITIRDLERLDGGIRPTDANRNGRVDGFDLVQPLRDGGWADGINDDQNGISAKLDAGYVDDLVGWDFWDNDNDPRPTATVDQHGTAVASIMAAEGDNGTGMAGIVWRTSVIAVRAAAGQETLAAEMFQQAVRYVESMNAQVVNVSQGWSFTRTGYDVQCGIMNWQTSPPSEPKPWDAGVQQANREYAALFSGTRALYVFAAGNSGHFIEDDLVETLPQEAVLRAIPQRTVVVGAARDANSNVATSHYGSPVELWAPGWQWNLPTYALPQNGTSFAAPAVAGAAVLLASHNPQFLGNAAGLKRALTNTAATSVTVTCKQRSIPNQRLLNVQDLLGAPP